MSCGDLPRVRKVPHYAQGRNPASLDINTKRGLWRPFPSRCPASVQIHTKSGLRKSFLSRCPKEVPPAYKSIQKVASGSHFPAGGPGRPRQHANPYENWSPEAISQEVAPPAYKSIRKVASGDHFPTSGQGAPASVQIYTKSDLRKLFPSR